MIKELKETKFKEGFSCHIAVVKKLLDTKKQRSAKV
jgi:hypothetical protein